MTTTEQKNGTVPGTIRARIDPKALSRVTRIYDASLADILNETFQNARRARATQLHVHITQHNPSRKPLTGPQGPYGITIVDDGTGISDPDVLLAYGDNGWSDTLVEEEDAAGMGLLSLARHACTIASRTAGVGGEGAGWQVHLTPAHFTGELEASIEPDPQAPRPHGTSISFTTPASYAELYVHNTIAASARNYPLPVHVHTKRPDEEPGHYQARQTGYLDEHHHATPWRGMTFAARKNAPNATRGRYHNDTNVHGMRLNADLPIITDSAGDIWSVRADVERAPELELLLPRRTHPVETPFLESMRAQGKRVIYQAMAKDPEPAPTFEQHREAQTLKIEMAPPRPILERWRPQPATPTWEEDRERATITANMLIVDLICDSPMAYTIARAADRAGIGGTLASANPGLAGFDWYDQCPRIVHGEIEPGYEHTSHATSRVMRTPRPTSLTVRLTVHEPETNTTRSIVLSADVALTGVRGATPQTVPPIIAENATIDARELASLMHDAYFIANDDNDGATPRHQQTTFETEALIVASELLGNSDDALENTISHAIGRDIERLIPRGRRANIEIARGTVRTRLTPASVQAR